jgi:hypothetical protein
MDKISVSGTTTTFFNPKTNGKTVKVETVFDVDRSNNPTIPQKFSGPIDVMKETEPYGIALSSKLMRDLKLEEGHIVYFKIE